MKAVVAGAEGMLGEVLMAELFEADIDALGYGRQELDITDYHQTMDLIQGIKPDIIINCAAYTDVDGAESERSRALAVNALGARNLSLISTKLNSALLQFSTDFIFDGFKSGPYKIFDPAEPVNFYGYTKYIGEQYVYLLTRKHFVIRTSWLFGENGKNFVNSILDAAARNKSLKVVDDQTGSPTYAKDLAVWTIKLMKTPFYGIYHLANQGYVNRYDFARQICRFAGYDIEIIPVKTKELERPAQRPQNSRLDPFPLEETIGTLLPHWEDALKRHLKIVEAGG